MKEQDPIKILLAEDDPNLGTFLRSYLSNKGFATDLFPNGEEAYRAFEEGDYNFCITDVMMPIKDGFALAKDIRKKDAKIPILFLTAKTLEADRLKGFQIGADDYMTKPFSMDELLLRIQAIYRRVNAKPSENNLPETFDLGGIEFNYAKQLLFNAEKKLKLTAKESELLFILCVRKNDVVERGEALLKVWHNDNYFSARSMDVYITKIRKILKEHSRAEIVNIHGVGFKLIINSPTEKS